MGEPCSHKQSIVLSLSTRLIIFTKFRPKEAVCISTLYAILFLICAGFFLFFTFLERELNKVNWGGGLPFKPLVTNIVAYLVRFFFLGFFPGLLGIIVFTYACLCHYVYRFAGSSFGEFLPHVWSLELPVGVTLFKILWYNTNSYVMGLLSFTSATLGQALTKVLTISCYRNYGIITIRGRDILEVWRDFMPRLISTYQDQLMLLITIWVIFIAIVCWMQ